MSDQDHVCTALPCVAITPRRYDLVPHSQLCIDRLLHFDHFGTLVVVVMYVAVYGVLSGGPEVLPAPPGACACVRVLACVCVI